MYGMRGRALEERVSALLERLDLADAADRVVSTFSGGMQRRLDVAIGLVHRPQVLFLDEPTTGLDPEGRAGLWEEIERLMADEGLTILLTTHYLEEADRLARRLVIVDRGRVVAAGSPEQLKGELAGDTLHIELVSAPQNGEVQRGLAAVDGLREVVLEGRTLRARADSGATAVPAVLAALDTQGVGVAAVTVARPSLDDVYLRYAGRAFSEADREVAP
jgi:ABC-2 type transport system ATP-binding protein